MNAHRCMRCKRFGSCAFSCERPLARRCRAAWSFCAEAGSCNSCPTRRVMRVARPALPAVSALRGRRQGPYERLVRSDAGSLSRTAVVALRSLPRARISAAKRTITRLSLHVVRLSAMSQPARTTFIRLPKGIADISDMELS